MYYNFTSPLPADLCCAELFNLLCCDRFSFVPLGWEAEGKHGYRTAVISLLTSLHSLGQARLVLREVLLTGVQIDREVTARSFEAQEFYFLVKRLLEKLPPTAEPVSE